MEMVVEKAARRLRLMDGKRERFSCRVALGREPMGAKRREGDGRTPEGAYFICIIKEAGKYGRSLGLSYPNVEDALEGYRSGLIDERTLAAIKAAQAEHRRPPWGSPMGGEIYLHEGGAQSDWTQGCIALESADMDVVFANRAQIEQVIIRP